MAHVAPWMASLSSRHRRLVVEDACLAVGPAPDPVFLDILVLIAPID
jgi:hypothetical protein